MSNPKEQFIADLYPAARRVGQETGMSWELILAQAALETDWGQKVLPGTNNIFNIKADASWQGESREFRVKEYIDRKWVERDDPFRVYPSYEDALRDRVEFLRDNSRYTRAGLFEEGTLGDLRREAEALQRAGYATDPEYADKLVEVFGGRTMRNGIALGREHVADQAVDVAQPPPAQTRAATGDGTWPAPGNHSVNAADKPGEGAGGWNTSRPAHRDGDGHDGVDIQGRRGDPILAFKGGTVLTASFVRGYGNTVDIRHDNGDVTRYAHLDSIDPRVRAGRSVTEGQHIGAMGQTGNSPKAGDAHLHFEYRVKGRDVDPMPYLGRASQEAGQQAARSAAADGVLKTGDRGPEVIALQEQLNALGYRGRNGQPLETGSGIYGPETEHAVRSFQRAHSLEPDGKAGRGETLPALDRARTAPLVSEASHPNHTLFAEVERRIAAQTGQAPGREAVANITLQMLENGFRNAQDIQGLAVQGSNVHVQGPAAGARVSVDLQAPTPDLQAMSDHMGRQTQEQEREQRQREQAAPVLPG